MTKIRAIINTIDTTYKNFDIIEVLNITTNEFEFVYADPQIVEHLLRPLGYACAVFSLDCDREVIHAKRV